MDTLKRIRYSIYRVTEECDTHGVERVSRFDLTPEKSP
jgi:hypothetical protein